MFSSITISRCARLALLAVMLTALVLACARPQPTSLPATSAPASEPSAPAAGSTPSPRPTATATRLGGPLVSGDPADLALSQQEVPAGLRLASEEHPAPGEYSVVYFRPEALTAPGPPGDPLLAVTINIALAESRAAARALFAKQGSLDETDLLQQMRGASGEVVPLTATPLSVRLEGAQDVLAYRVEYAIGPTFLVDYRYRLLVDNSVTNLIVSALTGSGKEPASLQGTAEDLARRQLERILIGPGAPGPQPGSV